MPGGSVIIVSFRTPVLTTEAAQSALDSGADEVVVVDNASGDDTVSRLRRLDDVRLRVLERASNAGFGTAANEGARAASSDMLLFLNSDARLSADARTRLVDAVAQCAGRAIVGPRLVGVDGSVQRSTGIVLGPASLTVRALGLHRLATALFRLPFIGDVARRSSMYRDYGLAATADQPQDVGVVTGACFAVGRDAFLELGAFDEAFFLYFEDTDLCRRARAAGLAVRYVPDAVVPHIGGASSAADYHFGPAHARSMRQYLHKWYGPGGAVLAVALLWLRALAFTLTLRPGTGRAWGALRAAVRPGDGPP